MSLYSKPCRIGRDNAFISTYNCLYYYYLTDQKIYRLIGESFLLVLFGQLKGLVWISKPSWRNSGRVSACTVIKTYARINEFCALTFAPFFKCPIYTVGEFGRYQWIQYLLHLLPAFTGGVFYQTFKEEIVFEWLPQIISLLAWKQLKTCEYFFFISLLILGGVHMLSQVEVGATPRHRFIIHLHIIVSGFAWKGISDDGKQKLITHYLSDLYRQMSGGERHYIRVRRIVPLRLGAERNSTLQSVGIRSHLLWIHHRYRCKNFRPFLTSFILILIEFFILSFFL